MNRLALIALLFASPLWADVVIETPQPQNKSLMVLTAGGSDAATAGLIWDVYPLQGVEKYESGGALNFTGPIGQYTVTLRAVLWDKKTILTATKAVTIGQSPAPPVTPPTTPTTPTTPTVPTDKATAVVYVYEKDQHAIPNQVLSALNKLNRERGIIATAIEADVKDGTEQVPEQYRTALEAAKKAGLPVLVVMSGDKVLAVVKAPKSETEVLEVVK